MHRVLFSVLTLAWLLTPTVSNADIKPFDEEFAFSTDRNVPLKQLIPGTRNYYFYKCLHLQNQGKLKEVDALIKKWEARHRWDRTRRRQIENRQALLRYATDPKTSVKYFISKLGISHNHYKSTYRRSGKRNSKLDESKLERSYLLNKYLKGSRYGLYRFTRLALYPLSQMKLTDRQRRSLLQKLRNPATPGLVNLINDELSYKYSRGFGRYTIHKMLTLKQMDALLKLRPALLSNSTFVTTYIKKLHPNPDVAWEDNLKLRQAYLTRLWTFVKRLSPSFNSLKLHVMNHQLRLDQQTGTFNQTRFLDYIQLPRYASYINNDYVRDEQNRGYIANRNSYYQSTTQLSSVGNDEPLIRNFLMEYFKKAETYKDYSTYLRESYLKKLYAETKLLHGLGDAEKWYALLSPSYLKQLKERVTLTFAPTNKKVFGNKELVKLKLDIKNVKNLIVKVYSINAESYYKKNLKKLKANLNLDGLVANTETTHTYNLPSVRMQRKSFSFPTLKKQGIYIIDFIGNGTNSRALIRKGHLRMVERYSVAGHVINIFDGQGKWAPNPYVWMANRKYTADSEGNIVIPYSSTQSKATVILGSRDNVSLSSFTHKQEQYAYTGSFFVDRESLIKRRKATVVLRSKLQIHGATAPLSLIKNVKFQMTAVDRFGVKTTTTSKNFKLHLDKESTYTFRVPENLSRVTFSISGYITKACNGKRQSISGSRSFTINNIDKTSILQSFVLSQVKGNYMLDLLDRTGIPFADKRVYIQLKNKYLTSLLTRYLYTNKKGRVELGSLKDIEYIVVRTNTSRTRRKWFMQASKVDLPNTLTGLAGGTLSLPHTSESTKITLAEYTLHETRKGSIVKDHSSALSLSQGLIMIKDLPAGDYIFSYRLLGKKVLIKLTQGKKRDMYFVGKHRALEASDNQPLQISSLEMNGKQLKVQLVNSGKYTRVHIVATRYLPLFNAFAYLKTAINASPRWQTCSIQPSQYLAGRNIGEEYRYILERKYAKKFPGNMLKRPSLLLNPWAIRKTQTSTRSASTGSGFGSTGSFGRGYGGGGGKGWGRAGFAIRARSNPNLDFLPQSSVVLINWRPDKNGVVTVDKKKLAGLSLVQVVAVDPDHTAYKSISLAETKLKAEDQRLRANLSSQKHFTQQSKITTVAKSKSFTLNDITTSKFEVFDSLQRVYDLYTTLTKNPKLAKFGFLMNWEKLSAQDKAKKYNKFASHELHFFLYKKDRAFFDKVVKPYIANKKDKTFLDHWLLENDLKAFLRPRAYNQLNIVERILLSQRIDGEQANTKRHIQEWVETLRPQILQGQTWFTTALQLGTLSTEKSGGLPGLNALRDGLLRMKEKSAMKNGDSDNDDSASDAPPPPPMARPAAEAAKPMAPMKKSMYRLRARRKRKAKMFLKLDKFSKDMRARNQFQQLYQALEKTKEYVENNYFELPLSSQNGSLIKMNPFWGDYAGHDGKSAFVSKHVARASGNFTEMMFVLSVLDLPYQSPKHDYKLNKVQVTLKAASPMMVFFKAIREAKPPKTKTPILVSQNFYESAKQYRYVRGKRVERYITDEFLIRKMYACKVVVTNPTSSSRKLEVLYQIPQGAIPLSNGKRTYTRNLTLGSYRTTYFTYYFYFPKAGTFDHFPVHVAQQGKLVAFAKPLSIKVVNKPTKVDKTSWEYVSQNGTLKEVFDYLNNHNLRRTNLSRLAWRMKNADSYKSIISYLRKNHVYNRALWGYAFKHGDKAGMSDVLQHSFRFTRHVGMAVVSPLLTLNPVTYQLYEHKEYMPLVNARVHQLGRRRKILNNRFAQQYNAFLKLLHYRPQLSAEDLLAGVYYMLLQDRVDKALALFKRIDSKGIKSQLQYDYAKVYLAFFQNDLKTARTVASTYKKHPVPRWRNKFADALQQLDEIEGKTNKVKTTDPNDRDQKQTKQASKEASFTFEITGKKLAISSRNLKSLRIHYYLMDIELLFSRSPFVQKHNNQFAYIQPNLVERVDVKGRKMTWSLPKQFHNKNVMVEITGAGLQQSKAYYSNEMDVQVIENYGHLHVTSSTTNKAISKAYVKVYARLNNGSIVFYKDGYTDLRGRFDYTSLSTNTLTQVKRFSILVMSPEHGAIVREAAPPKQ